METSSPTILIVDDSAKNLQVVGETLSQLLDCELSFATSGQMALESVVERAPDLILLDVMMPGMNGFEVCQKLKADPRTAGIPVIFLTAKAESKDIVAGFAAGGVDYITKPFNPAELHARVSTRLELKRASSVIEGKNRELRQLLQVLCHDLANPLASICGWLDVCATDPNALADLLPDIRKIAARAMDQIKLVREMHSVEEGHYCLSVVAFPLAESLAAAASGLDQMYRAKDIRLVLSLPPELEVRVEPVSFINTVLANLLSNAAKFSFRGGEVAVEARRAAAGHVTIEIRDQGVGIPPAKLEKLFVPSAHSSTAGTEGETGTGFGMPLVKSFTEAYGGTIEVVSRDRESHPDDHGTVVTLVLKEAGGTP